MLTPVYAQRGYWKLPAPGSLVVCLADGPRRYVHGLGRRLRRFRVVSYPGAREFRHCATITALDNGQRFTVSGHWLEAA